MPPMRTDRFNAGVVKLNEIYKEYAEKAGAKYIDIWDAFADQNGQYDASGPNVDGQNVKLRGADGIHFTKAGSRKVAHFLEAEIRARLRQGRSRRTRPPTCRPTSSRRPATSTRRSVAKWARPRRPAPRTPARSSRPSLSPGRSCR